MTGKNYLSIMLALILLSACGGTFPEANPSPQTAIRTPTPTHAYPPATIVTTPTYLPIDLTPAQLAALQALSDRHNIPIENITILSTEAVTWPDGCLGVDTPGVMCTQALVEGYRIILEANGQQYEYHTDQDGSNVVQAANILP